MQQARGHRCARSRCALSVLLMDEPFGALDAFTREEDETGSWRRSGWRRTPPIVFITHSIEEALFLSDRVVVLSGRGGPGTLHEIYDVDLPRPRTMEIMAGREVFDLTHRIKADIYGLNGDGSRFGGGGVGQD